MVTELSPRSEPVTGDPPARAPLFSPRGRVGRLQLLGYATWFPAIVGLFGAVVGALVSGGSETAGIAILEGSLVAAALVSLVFYIKRCHDFNASGWWALGMLVPLANLVYLLVPGTDGPNRFGLQPPPNTWKHWVLGISGFLVFFVGGVAAAVFVPAYQDYSARAQIGSVFESVATTRGAVERYVQEYGNYPGADSIATMGLETVADPAGLVESIDVAPGTGAVTARLRASADLHVGISGKSVRFCPTPLAELDATGRLSWNCSSNAPQRFLPRACEGDGLRPCP